MSVTFASAIGSHVGLARSNNQDSGFAGGNLFFVADGMGGHAGGDVASSTLTKFVADIDGSKFETTREAAEALAEQLLDANEKLRETVKERPEVAGMGTTFSGFFTNGEQLGIAHIGDSRIYLYRDGRLQQVTVDHTFVQKLIDSGQITEEEARVHPRRSVLMRVLGDVEVFPEIETTLVETEPGDIWLLCSDGLCGYVSEKVIAHELARGLGLQQTVDNLIDRTLEVGAPDNVTVALVQTVAQTVPEPGEIDDTAALPVRRFVGAAAKGDENSVPLSTSRTKILLGRRRKKVQAAPEAHFEPRVDEYLAELIAETKRRTWRRRAMLALTITVAAAAVLLAVFFGYQFVQSRYFVGTDGNTVIIYRGVQADIGPFSLSNEAENTNIPLQDLNPYEQRQVERTLNADSLEQAREIVLRIGGGD